MEINIKIQDGELLEVLKALLSDNRQAKMYFEENTNEESRIGMTSPEEVKEVYNNILTQAKQQGILSGLDLIK
ncbi:hypothetical protein OW763_07655 [Clostridium aestuarii]|uniref:Uncharacterized protein n=1 Tax=Clostridium aestuarii TaxID=338193 RepID=A0ABT4CZ29_9CLOT|nr:hypothetical protein [Clostridium aestuarii]MCY6484230.1 hypothetical protein [Clostridium aestuarii]